MSARPSQLTLTQQQQAITLYASGKSMQQIADHFEVTIHAVVYTLRKYSIPRRSAAESNAIRFEAKELSYSIKTDLSVGEEQLKLAATMLYWAEGYKAGKNTVDFANSDARMALLFITFLREICRVDERRIRCSLYCYQGQDIDAITDFWSEHLAVPKTQFIRPYIKQGSHGPRGPRMKLGLVHIRYCDKKLLREILAWIEEYAQKCVGGRVVNCTSL